MAWTRRREAKEEGFHVNSARDLFFCVWLNLFNIYDWPHQDSQGSNPPAMPILLLKVAEVGPHASSSRPRPSLWPPALMFFPSTSADRVSFMPGINTLTSLFQIMCPDSKTGRLPIVSEAKRGLTRTQALSVSDSYQTCIVHLGLQKNCESLLVN